MIAVRVEDELPDGVEVAAHYGVSELVTNTAKQAQASAVDVAVTSGDGLLDIVAQDGRPSQSPLPDSK